MTDPDQGHVIDHTIAFHSHGPLLRMSMGRAANINPPPPVPNPAAGNEAPDGAINMYGSQDLYTGP